MRVNDKRTTRRLPFAAGVLLTASVFACLQPPEAGDQGGINEDVPPGQIVAAHFEADINTADGTIEITMLEGTSFAGLDPANVVQDGVAGSGPANSVELVTTTTEFNCAGFPNSFCATVVLRSFYTGVLGNATVQLTSIVPFAGHAPLNSDPPFMGLSNTFGLWVYGNLAANGGAATELWAFGNDGTSFRIRGRVMADLPTGGGAPSTFRVFQADMVGNAFTGCAQTPPEFLFGDNGLCSPGGGVAGRTTAGFQFTDTLGSVPSTLGIDFALQWICGTAGQHNVTLNDVSIGSISSSDQGCVCNPPASRRLLTVNNPPGYVAGGNNVVLVHTVPGSACYTLGPDANLGNAYAEVTLTP